MTAWAVVLAAFAAAAFGLGSVLQARGAAGAPPWRVLVRRPDYLGGQLADGMGYVCSLIAVRILPVFVVEGILATSLGVTAVCGRIVLGTRVRRLDTAAIGVVICGAVALAATGVRNERPTGGRLPELGIVVLVVVLLLGIGPAMRAGRSGALAVLAGSAFAGEVLAERVVRVAPGLKDSVVLLARQPVSWALAVLAVLGAALYARALGHGNVGPVTAIPLAVEIAVPSVIGVAVLGDAVRAGWAALAVVALLATLAATAVLATSLSSDVQADSKDAVVTCPGGGPAVGVGGGDPQSPIRCRDHRAQAAELVREPCVARGGPARTHVDLPDLLALQGCEVDDPARHRKTAG